MTKSTLATIYSILTSIDFEDKTTIMDALDHEIHKGDAVKAEKAALYESVWPIVAETLGMAEAPVTVAEIWESIEDEVPSGFTKSKLSYGLSHQWTSKVAKTEGKVYTYALA